MNSARYLSFEKCKKKYAWNVPGIPGISWNLRGTYMSTVILSGTTLLEYVQQARNICGPDFPIIGLNRQLLRYLCEYFNSLPHTEVDWLQEQIDKVYFHFNSLPHTEVDKSG